MDDDGNEFRRGDALWWVACGMAIASAMFLSLSGAPNALLTLLRPPELATTDPSDLMAQQHMAMAAWAMVAVTSISLIVGTITLIMLWATLRATAKGATAAEATVIETQRMTIATVALGQQQARAYVGATGCEAMLSFGEARCELAYSNSGQSPARTLSIDAHVFLRSSAEDDVFHVIDERSFEPDLPTGATDKLILSLRDLYRAIQERKVSRAQLDRLMVEGHIKYRDVFDDWHVEPFSFQLTLGGNLPVGLFGMGRSPQPSGVISN
jgi:hypothetical protein